MTTIQMTLEKGLLEDVDRRTKELKTSRSHFIRAALRDALKRIQERELEARHRRGYERHPVEPGEFDCWENEHAWGD